MNTHNYPLIMCILKIVHYKYQQPKWPGIYFHVVIFLANLYPPLSKLNYCLLKTQLFVFVNNV